MNNYPNVLIVIAARGGSKGVKGKNIKKILGKPLIAYTIDVALRWGKASHIICSTDSEDIAQIAKEYGAEIPFIRSANLSTDDAGKVSVIRDAWKKSENIYNEIFDVVVDLDVTAPIRTVSDLDKCIEIYIQRKPEIIYSVVNAKKNPYFNMVEKNCEGYFRLCKATPNHIVRRQDVPKVYEMNASIYFYSRSFLENESRTSVTDSSRAIAYVMDNASSIDIDSEMDFKYIEFLLKEGVIRL